MARKEDKKQVPLRLSAGLYQDLAAWAEDDFRSLNGQIEYLLTECVRRRQRAARGAEAPAPGFSAPPGAPGGAAPPCRADASPPGGGVPSAAPDAPDRFDAPGGDPGAP